MSNLNLLILPLLLLSTSCATASGEWETVTVSSRDEVWRPCHETLDGPAYHRKGLCFIEEECRKKFLRAKECRPKSPPKFCSWGDLECMDKNKLWDKVLKDADAVLILN